jgi:hypothetical protein
VRRGSAIAAGSLVGLGLIAVTAGVALIFVPAALIVGGTFIVGAGLLLVQVR